MGSAAFPDAEATRRLLETIAGFPRIQPVAGPLAAELATVADEAAEQFATGAASELAATESEIAAFVNDLDPDQRRALLERLGGVIVAVTAHVYGLVTNKSGGELLPTLVGVLFTLWCSTTR